MATKPEQQHYVPKVYLKQFQIDDQANKSFVYCINYEDKYRTQVQKLGINDKVFKIRKFYNDSRLTDPFAIEKVFAQDVEPKYPKIMSYIEKEELPLVIREDILSWLFFTQHRAAYIRDNLNRVMDWTYNTMNKLAKRELSKPQQEWLDEYIKKSAREIHLNAFSDEQQYTELARTHMQILNAKHWKIMKSPHQYPFLTSDNPGFSPNQHEKLAARIPFHHVMELSHHSVVYFVFSPDYCLEIRPFYEETPLEICALNMDIKFQTASKEYVDYINEGVYYSRHKLLISHSKEFLKRFEKQSGPRS